MTNSVQTIYLVPHSHTDVGYSHDPLVTLELHDRFLDRAIELCEQTRNYPEGAQFRWTVEVFSSALRWCEHRTPAEHARLRECLRRGEIDIGARYLNGTEYYAAEDVAWELAERRRLAELTGYSPVTSVQNDVNGFPLAFAAPLAADGVKYVMMGLNTTMGHSPFPRCHAFRWQVGDNRQLLVWNGWIYNRLKTFCHLDRIADELPAKIRDFLASLPPDYPYDFAISSATMGDNCGPFPALPEQVRRFNALNCGVQLRLATFTDVGHRLAASSTQLDQHAGNWPDFWTFGAGAMPQMTASLRRAQRRLRLVEAFRTHGWANATGGSLTLDRARLALAYACEHTFNSHTCSGTANGTSDAIRQSAQINFAASSAESISMVLLRDHLTAMAKALPPADGAGVLVANPHPTALSLDYESEQGGFRHFATSGQPEHLFQFDREPTFEALAADGTFGAHGLVAPAAAISRYPLAPCVPVELSPERLLIVGTDQIEIHPQFHGLASWRCAGQEKLNIKTKFPAFAPVIETPQGAFQLSGMADMDPSDCAWNPNLQLNRKALPGTGELVRRQGRSRQQSLTVEYTGSPCREMEYALDPRFPGRLLVTSRWLFDTNSTVRAYYLPLPLLLPGEGECEYWVDGCGRWFAAERGQLPGSCNSFYQAQRGVAVSRGDETFYIVAPDSTLFQLGGFTFGQLPSTPLQRRKPFVALWIYNNYWGTNFPSYSPGLFTARFLIERRSGGFDPAVAAALDATFDLPFLTHPLCTIQLS